MNEDSELLRRYAEHRDEAAFERLVQRHVNLVFSAALRQTDGDAQTAEDVTQTVFARSGSQSGPARAPRRNYRMALHRHTFCGRQTATRRAAPENSRTRDD